ncbi:uncharacterized protein L201_001497 [Kwoniella dendrophila CBS 6074]|uniref:Uncharacterized protein n=1 Tax=Kwoniella dendrophila CBS 6074 TaxID=1295534 RepID=A0AAX4JMH0_9TREE
MVQRSPYLALSATLFQLALLSHTVKGNVIPSGFSLSDENGSSPQSTASPSYSSSSYSSPSPSVSPYCNCAPTPSISYVTVTSVVTANNANPSGDGSHYDNENSGNKNSTSCTDTTSAAQSTITSSPIIPTNTKTYSSAIPSSSSAGTSKNTGPLKWYNLYISQYMRVNWNDPAPDYLGPASGPIVWSIGFDDNYKQQEFDATLYESVATASGAKSTVTGTATETLHCTAKPIYSATEERTVTMTWDVPVATSTNGAAALICTPKSTSTA